MARIGHNLAANLAGKAWYAALNFAFPPIYAKLLGIEAYGLVGLYTALVAILGVLDLGLSTTLNRELARLSDDPDGATSIGSTVRTFEYVYWTVGLLAGAAVFGLAPVIGAHWVRAQQMPLSSVILAIRLTGLVFALQWPGGLYAGGLVGLDRQVAANVVSTIFGTLRLVGAAVVLGAFRRSIDAFFGWQAVVFLLQTIAARTVLHHFIPRSSSGVGFSLSILRQHWRLSSGLFVVSILSMLLTNADKVIVSKLLTLRDLGYYTLAWTLGTALFAIIGPVFQAVFPRLTQLVRRGDEHGTARLYHLAAQTMAVLVLPAACAATFFSHELALAWTGDATTASEIRTTLAIVTAGSALNGVMNIPYALQLAHGWTKLAAWTNFFALLVFLPLVYGLTTLVGRTGAAWGWAGLNIAYVLISLHFQHRRLLKGELWAWYRNDNLGPLAAALAAVVPLRLLLAPAATRGTSMLWVIVACGAAYVAAALAAPRIRNSSLGELRRMMHGRA